MRRVNLGDIVSVIGGGTPRKANAGFYGGGIPWVTPKDMKTPLIDGSQVTLTELGVQSSPAKVVPAGSVLVVVRSGVLKHSLPIARASRPVTLNQDMKALVPGEQVDSSFLAHLLRASERTVLGWVRATTADNFPIAKLLDLEVSLPTRAEQRRVAAILDHADASRAKRRRVLAHLDDLTQSIFHEMFNDAPADVVALGDVVAHIENGASPKCEARPAESDEWGVLKLGAVTYGIFDERESKAFLGDVGAMAKNEVRSGDVLMTRKNTRDLVGAVAVVEDGVRPHLLLPDLIFRLHLDPDRLNAHYFHALMSEPRTREVVRGLSSGSAASMPNISKARLRDLPLRLPEISLQTEFAQRVASVTRLRKSVLQAAAADDELFASLQSRAFNGEL